MNKQFTVFILTAFLLCSQTVFCSSADSSCKIQPFSEISDSLVGYRAQIRVPGRNFSGLLYISRQDSLRYHAVFISELGMTIFELSVDADSAHLLYCFDVLKNRKALKSLIRHTECMIHAFTGTPDCRKYVKKRNIFYKFASKGFFCTTDFGGRVLKSKTGKGFARVVTQYGYSGSNVPEQIVVKQKWVRVKWELKKLEKV